MPKYTVQRPVKIDGEIHKPGCKPLELDAEAAAPLVASGSLAAVSGNANEPEPKEPEPKEPEPKAAETKKPESKAAQPKAKTTAKK